MHRTHSLHRTVFTRARTVAAVLSLAVVVASLCAAPAFADTAFKFTGAGYGHGIGLSQYGAKGFAEHGWLGEKIATYYFPGTKIGTVADPTITVNIDPGKTTSNAGYTRTSWQLRAGDRSSPLIVNGYSIPYTGTGICTFTGVTVGGKPMVQLTKPDGTKLGPWADVTVKPSGATPLIEVVSGSGIYNWASVRYRGTMKFKANTSNKLGLLNVLPMQDYLKGVVPRESPAGWHIEALKAQAIVARSYAYATTKPELFCTTWDQAYSGHSRYVSGGWTTLEHAASVDQTKGEYVMYGAKVVQTFFSSSSGGHTATLTDVWEGGSTAPYYQGVPDLYCAGPWDPWTSFQGVTYPRTISGLSLASKLAAKVTHPTGAGTTVSVRSLSLDIADSGFVRSVDITWSNGSVTKDVDGDTVRSALTLPSTKFFVSGPFTRISQPDRYSTASAISKSCFPAAGSAAVVVLVNGADAKFADALTSSALGGTAGGPVLLTAATTLPETTRAELARLKPAKVYVVGGPASVSDAVATKARLAAGAGTIVRLGGPDRYAVASAVALEIGRLSPTTATSAMVASGEKWPDSAIGAVAAAMSKRPLLLVSSTAVPPATATAIKSLKVTQTAVFGGEASLPPAVVSAVCKLTGETAPAKRFGVGGSRYDEAAAAASWCVSSFGASLGTVYVASGEVFPDSVTGGVLAARNKHPLVLTTGAAPAQATFDWLNNNRAAIGGIVVLGGPGSVSDNTASALGGAAN